MLITNLDQVRRGHDHLLASNERLLVESNERAGRFALDYVQTHSEFKRRTGALQDATKFRIIRTSGGRILRISNDKAYAPTIDGGSRAHTITAKPGKVLAFPSRSGVMMFRRTVRHPGTRPYKFLYNAADAASRLLNYEIERGMADLAKRF